MQTYYDFTDFLATLPAETVLLLAIISLLLFTLGLLLGWLLQKRSTRVYRKQAVIAHREKEAFQERLSAADDEQKSLTRELVQLTTEKDELHLQIQHVRTTNETLTTQLSGQRADNEQLTATNQSFSNTIEDLNDQVIGLKTRNAQLLGGEGPGASAGAGDAGLERRLRVVEEALADLRRTTAPRPPAPTLNLGRSTHQVRIGDPLAAAEMGTVAPAAGGDDLTRIKSIGPFNHQKLSTAGVTTFSQIAAWSDADIEDYAARIGYVAELIRIQDWVGQAQTLAATKATPKDLTELEAIDDELVGVLRDAGVRTLTDLAATPPAEIEAMLFQAGCSPVSGAESWPEQAARILAHDGDVSPVD